MRILVVDDHLPTVELMRLTFSSLGHSVMWATNVADALELLAADPPDVVLSDLTFPPVSGTGLDGYGLARSVRAVAGPTDIYLLAITGVASPAQQQEALDSGFDEVLVKPFDVALLIEQIETWYERRSAN